MVTSAPVDREVRRPLNGKQKLALHLAEELGLSHEESARRMGLKHRETFTRLLKRAREARAFVNRLVEDVLERR